MAPGTIPVALGILAVGGALMTKMTVGLLPALFFLPLLRQREQWWKPLAIIVAGVALALPWYLHMFLTYGDDVWLAMSIPHLWEAVEGNAASMGPLYYVNQLVRAHPVTVVAFVYVVFAVFNRRLLPNGDQQGAFLSLAWFIVVMLVFSLAATKNPHYVVMLLPPTLLVAVYAYEQIVLHMDRRTTVMMYATMLVAGLYVLLPGVTAEIRAGEFTAWSIGVPAAMLLILVAALVVPRSAAEAIVVKGYRAVFNGLLVIGGFGAVSAVFQGRSEDIRGGRQIAVALLEQAEYYKEFTYLYHRHNAGDAMNPQLAWYTAGWMNGWQDGYTYTPVYMPPETYDLDAVAAIATQPLPWVVYYHPGISEEVRTQVMAGLAISYDVYEKLDHYTLFVKR